LNKTNFNRAFFLSTFLVLQHSAYFTITTNIENLLSIQFEQREMQKEEDESSD